jgi:Icc protein
MKVRFIACLCLITILGCNSSEYSPNQKFNNTSATDVNAKQIALLPIKASGAHLRIAVSGDTQRNYKDAQLFVNHINSRNDIDFVVLNGDISDFGLLLEFDGIYKIYSGLKVPFVCVIGNHDILANGEDVFKRMFGPVNFTFNCAGIKFVCHDSNSREYNFNGEVPSLDWLRKNLTLETGIDHLVALSHVPPTDLDFDSGLRIPYETLMNNTPGMLASIHSHQHSPDVIYRQDGKGIPFIITNAIVNRAYTIINIQDATLNAQAVSF